MHWTKHSFEHTPTESSVGGTRLYIAKDLYPTIIFGVICRHQKMNVNDLKNNFLNNLQKKINHKQSVSFSDFDIYLMDRNEHKPTNEFLDSFAL